MAILHTSCFLASDFCVNSLSWVSTRLLENMCWHGKFVGARIRCLHFTRDQIKSVLDVGGSFALVLLDQDGADKFINIAVLIQMLKFLHMCNFNTCRVGDDSCWCYLQCWQVRFLAVVILNVVWTRSLGKALHNLSYQYMHLIKFSRVCVCLWVPFCNNWKAFDSASSLASTADNELMSLFLLW